MILHEDWIRAELIPNLLDRLRCWRYGHTAETFDKSENNYYAYIEVCPQCKVVLRWKEVHG